MDSLPPELLRLTCSNLAYGSKDVQYFRLVNKAFASAGEPYLTHNLSGYEWDINGMLEKLQHPGLGKYITKVLIDPSQPVYHDTFEAWREERIELYVKPGGSHYQTAVADILSLQHLQSLWQRYETLVRRSLDGTSHTEFIHNLDKFFTAESRIEHLVVTTRAGRQPRTPLAYFENVCLSDHLTEDHPEKAKDVAVMLGKLLSASKKAKHVFRSLTVIAVDPDAFVQMPHAEPISSTFTSLTSLRMLFQLHECYHTEGSGFRKLLSQARNLRTLKIGAVPYYYSPALDLEDILADGQWEHLTCFAAKNFMTTEEHFVAFLGRHQQLEDVSLATGLLDEGRWRSALRRTAGTMPRLRRFRNFTWLWSNEATVECYEFEGSACVPCKPGLVNVLERFMIDGSFDSSTTVPKEQFVTYEDASDGPLCHLPYQGDSDDVFEYHCEKHGPHSAWHEFEPPKEEFYEARSAEPESSELEFDELETDELETDDLGTDELENDELENDELENDKLGTDNLEADEVKNDERGTDDLESDELETDEFEPAEFGESESGSEEE